MTIEKLEEFAESGEKHLNNLDVKQGFQQAEKPERQWFNYLLNDFSKKINQVIDGLSDIDFEFDGFAPKISELESNYTEISSELTRVSDDFKSADAVLQGQIDGIGGGKFAYTTYAKMEAAAALPDEDPLKLPANSSVDVTNDTDPLKNGTYSYDGAVFTKSIYDVETIVRTKVLNTFKTKALMDASALPDGADAQVTDDTANNGLYVKTAGAWVKSTYDPLTQSKAYTDLQLSKLSGTFDTLAALNSTTLADGSFARVSNDAVVANNGDYKKVSGVWVATNSNKLLDPERLKKQVISTVVLSDFPTLELWIAPNGNWGTTNRYGGIFVPVKEGYTYRVTALDNMSAYQMKDGNYKVVPFVSANRVDILAGASLDIVIGAGIKYLWLSQKENALPARPKSLEILGDKLLYTSDIVKNDLDGNARLPVSARVTKSIRDDLINVEQYLNGMPEPQYKPIKGLTFTKGGFVLQNNSFETTNNPDAKSFDITLLSGDVLTFDYKPIRAIILWEVVIPRMGYSLLDSQVREDRLKNHRFVAFKDMTVTVTSADESSLKVNGLAPIAIVDRGIFSAAQLYRPSTVDDPAYENYIRSSVLSIKKGDTIKVTAVGDNNQPIITESTTNTGFFVQSVGVSADNPNKNVEWTAQVDTRVYLSGTTASTFLIKKENTIKNSLDGILYDYKSLADKPITNIDLPGLEYVFATHQNFVLKTEVKSGVEQIAISQDVGKTWTYTPNVIGDIVSYHFYSDGTIQLCSPTAVWWTSNYTTFTQASVFDHDGTVFVPTTHHFFNQQNGDTTMFVGNTEIYVWGEYLMGSNTPRIWYSTDCGRTVKCSFMFGVNSIGGELMRARHIHDIAQDKDTETFYVTTGDVTVPTYTENHFIKAVYDEVTDTFTWTVIGSGAAFKLGKIFFDKAYLYFITDYTPDTGLQDKNGIYRVGKKYIEDSTKYRPIYITNPAEWGEIAPFRLVMDRNGNKVLLLDWVGQGVIWVAREGMDFKKTTINPKVLLSYVIGPNYNGDVYCVPNNLPFDVTKNPNLKLSGGTYNLTKALRENSIRDFMKGNLLSNDIQHN